MPDKFLYFLKLTPYRLNKECWNIDISKELEKYLAKLENYQDFRELSFQEIGLVLSAISILYTRRIHDFEKEVYALLDKLSNSFKRHKERLRKLAEEEERARKEQDAQQDEENQQSKGKAPEEQSRKEPEESQNPAPNSAEVQIEVVATNADPPAPDGKKTRKREKKKNLEEPTEENLNAYLSSVFSLLKSYFKNCDDQLEGDNELNFYENLPIFTSIDKRLTRKCCEFFLNCVNTNETFAAAVKMFLTTDENQIEQNTIISPILLVYEKRRLLAAKMQLLVEIRNRRLIEKMSDATKRIKTFLQDYLNSETALNNTLSVYDTPKSARDDEFQFPFDDDIDLGEILGGITELPAVPTNENNNEVQINEVSALPSNPSEENDNPAQTGEILTELPKENDNPIELQSNPSQENDNLAETELPAREESDNNRILEKTCAVVLERLPIEIIAKYQKCVPKHKPKGVPEEVVEKLDEIISDITKKEYSVVVEKVPEDVLNKYKPVEVKEEVDLDKELSEWFEENADTPCFEKSDENTITIHRVKFNNIFSLPLRALRKKSLFKLPDDIMEFALERLQKEKDAIKLKRKNTVVLKKFLKKAGLKSSTVRSNNSEKLSKKSALETSSKSRSSRATSNTSSNVLTQDSGYASNMDVDELNSFRLTQNSEIFDFEPDNYVTSTPFPQNPEEITTAGDALSIVSDLLVNNTPSDLGVDVDGTSELLQDIQDFIESDIQNSQPHVSTEIAPGDQGAGDTAAGIDETQEDQNLLTNVTCHTPISMITSTCAIRSDGDFEELNEVPEGKFLNTVASQVQRYQLLEESKLEIAKRVQEWENFIKPKLELSEQRKTYDIHDYENGILESLGDIPTPFQNIVQGMPPEEIARNFLACLQLTNDGNIDIVEKTFDPVAIHMFKIQKLSNTRNYQQLNSKVTVLEEFCQNKKINPAESIEKYIRPHSSTNSEHESLNKKRCYSSTFQRFPSKRFKTDTASKPGPSNVHIAPKQYPSGDRAFTSTKRCYITVNCPNENVDPVPGGSNCAKDTHKRKLDGDPYEESVKRCYVSLNNAGAPPLILNYNLNRQNQNICDNSVLFSTPKISSNIVPRTLSTQTSSSRAVPDSYV